MIEILYFARIREILGVSSEKLELASNIKDIAALIEYLCDARDAKWTTALQQENLLMAVNQTMTKADHGLREGDEVAFFPPVSGG
jgi:molybdopterin synthase sulfur carrier subunit